MDLVKLWKMSLCRKLKEKYESMTALKSKREMLVSYMFHHGILGVQSIVDKLTSRLLGGSNNLKEWRSLLGVSWKRWVIGEMLLTLILNQWTSFRFSSNLGSHSRDPDQWQIMTSHTLNITGYSPQQMGNDTLFHVAFPFHKEANWYKGCCSEYNDRDYYAKMYNLLEDTDLQDFWTNLGDCFEKVCTWLVSRYLEGLWSMACCRKWIKK